MVVGARQSFQFSDKKPGFSKTIEPFRKQFLHGILHYLISIIKS